MNSIVFSIFIIIFIYCKQDLNQAWLDLTQLTANVGSKFLRPPSPHLPVNEYFEDTPED